jgi:mono/diheme cytochrome c family protein
VLLAAGCDLPGRPRPADRPVPADQVLGFDALYQTNCAGCHGADGTLGPAPPLNDALFRAAIPEKEVRRVVSEGRPGTPMPAFAKDRSGSLTAAQIDVLVKEIKGIPYNVVKNGDEGTVRVEVLPKWGTPGPLAKNVPSYLPEDKAGTARGDPNRGRKRFAQACAGCHGRDGKGGMDAGAINDPAFLALISDQALRRLVITGRPDLGMPDYAGTADRHDFQPLTSADVADLVALLQAWREGGSVDGKEATVRRHKQ